MGEHFEPTVRMKIIYGENFFVDLLSCKYKHKYSDDYGWSYEYSWIYLAGAKNFDGYILVVNNQRYSDKPLPLIVGLLTEFQDLKTLENAQNVLQKAFNNFLFCK